MGGLLVILSGVVKAASKIVTECQCTVGIQNPTIRNPETFEIRTFLTSGFRMGRPFENRTF